MMSFRWNIVREKKKMSFNLFSFFFRWVFCLFVCCSFFVCASDKSIYSYTGFSLNSFDIETNCFHRRCNKMYCVCGMRVFAGVREHKIIINNRTKCSCYNYLIWFLQFVFGGFENNQIINT